MPDFMRRRSAAGASGFKKGLKCMGRYVLIVTQMFGGRPALLMIVTLVGCSTIGGRDLSESRSLAIGDGRFSQSEIEVRAGRALTLFVTLWNWQAVTVSLPELGVGPTKVPANRVNPYSVKGTAAGNLRKARIALRPLKPGQYQIICDCPGGTEIARLIVDPAKPSVR